MARTLALAFTLASACTLPLFAQAPDRQPLRLSDGGALHLLDGRLVGGGTHYKVRFDEDGFELTPAFGPAAPRNFPLTFQLEEIARGTESAPIERAEPTWRELRVEYDRGAAIERYDIGDEAMEQSFVFAERPAGIGDLVVRGRLATDLAVSEDGDGLRCALADVGHLSLGAVFGIDANGWRVHGSVRYANGFVELVLPASFVDAAALPFTLDPPFGNVQLVTEVGGRDDQSPYVGYDATNDIYLVIWSRIFSATDMDVHGQLVRTFLGSGFQRVGGRLLIEDSQSFEYEPQVAGCDGRNAFVVVYTRDGDIIGRTVSSSSGVISGGHVIAGGTGSFQHFGTVATNIGRQNVLCCWQSDGDVALQATAVVVDSNLTLSTPHPVHTFADVSLVSAPALRPRLGKSDGGAGRHALVFQRDFGTAGSNSDIRFLILGSNGAPILPEGGSLDATLVDDENAEVDGDGTNWVVAWQRLAAAGDHDILATSISYDPTTNQRTLNTGFVQVANQSPEQVVPSVTWTGDSCEIGWSQQLVPGTAQWGARLKTVDPFTCGRCERSSVYLLVSSGYELVGSPFGCGAASGDLAQRDLALFAWEANAPNSGFNGDILVQSFRADDGIATDLGGGCGEGGTNRATCAALSNSSFRFRLRDATPFAPAVLFLSPVQSTFTCNPCSLKTSLAFYFSLSASTNQLGHAEIPFAISSDPALQGVSIVTQWLTLPPSPPPCALFSFHLSNGLDVRLQ